MIIKDDLELNFESSIASPIFAIKKCNGRERAHPAGTEWLSEKVFTKIDAALQRNRNEVRIRLMLNGNASLYNAADAEANLEIAEMLCAERRKPNVSEE